MLPLLRGFLDDSMLSKLQEIAIQPDSRDQWSWQATTSGNFWSAFANRLLLDGVVNDQQEWRHIWDFKGPSRPSMTLWLLKHGRLPTTAYLWRRNIVEAPGCSVCHGSHEDIVHALRDCPRSRRVWKLLLQGVDIPAFWRTVSAEEWLKLNLSTTMECLTNHLH